MSLNNQLKEKHDEEKRNVEETLNEYWRDFQVYTDKLSTVCRQLAFAEGGIFWIFFQKNVPEFVLPGFFFLILYFGFDVLQYYFGRKNYLELAEKSQEKYEANNKIKFEDIKKSKFFDQTTRKLVEIKLTFITLASGVLFIVLIKNFLCNQSIHIQ